MGARPPTAALCSPASLAGLQELDLPSQQGLMLFLTLTTEVMETSAAQNPVLHGHVTFLRFSREDSRVWIR